MHQACDPLIEFILPFAISTTLVSLSPGLNALLVVQTSLAHGIKQSLHVIAGQQFSLAVQMLLVAIGIAQVNEQTLRLIQIIGAIYLSYMGIKLLLSPEKQTEHKPHDENAKNLFLRGFVVNATNPKSILFQVSFVPQFINHEMPGWTQYIILGAIMLTIESIVLISYAFTAEKIKTTFNSKKTNQIINGSCGVLFIAIGTWMFIYNT